MARVKLPMFQPKKLLLKERSHIQDQEESIVKCFEEYLFLSLKLPRRFFREILGTKLKWFSGIKAKARKSQNKRPSSSRVRSFTYGVGGPKWQHASMSNLWFCIKA